MPDLEASYGIVGRGEIIFALGSSHREEKFCLHHPPKKTQEQLCSLISCSCLPQHPPTFGPREVTSPCGLNTCMTHFSLEGWCAHHQMWTGLKLNSSLGKIHTPYPEVVLVGLTETLPCSLIPGPRGRAGNLAGILDQCQSSEMVSREPA